MQKQERSVSNLLIGFSNRGNYNLSPLFLGGKNINNIQANKNISNSQFVSSPSLIKKYGWWKDTDKDKWLNFADCYPFDKNRHDDVQPGQIIFGKLGPNLESNLIARGLKRDENTGMIVPVSHTGFSEAQAREINEASQKGQWKQAQHGILTETRNITYTQEVQAQARATLSKQPQQQLITTQQPTTVTTKKLPAGYTNKELLNVYTEALSKVKPKYKYESDWNKAVRLREDPQYENILKEYKQKVEDIKSRISQQQIESSYAYQQEQRTKEYLAGMPKQEYLGTGAVVVPYAPVKKEFSATSIGFQTKASEVSSRIPSVMEYEPREQRAENTIAYVAQGTRGTLSYRPRVVEEMPPTQAYERRLQEQQFKLEHKINQEQQRIQSQINSEEITYEEGKSQMDKILSKSNEELNKINEKLIKKYEVEKAKFDIGLNIGKGAGIGVLSVIAAPIAWTLIGRNIAGTIFNPDISLGQKGSAALVGIGSILPGKGGLLFISGGVAGSIATSTNPLASGISTASFGFGAIMGGYGASKTKSMIKNARIAKAVENAQVRIKSAGKLNEKAILDLELSKENKIIVKKILEQGGSVRVFETELKPGKGYKAYTPNVKGKFIEVLNQQGKLINRIGVGEIKATFDGKTIDRYSFSKAILKLNEGSGVIQGYAELATAKTISEVQPFTPFTFIKKGKAIVGLEKYKIYEEAKQVGMKKVKGGRVIKSEAYIELLGKERYKGGELLKGYGKQEGGLVVFPDYSSLKGTGKPYSRAKYLEIQKQQKAKVEIVLDKSRTGIGRVSTTFLTTGIGVAERIKEVGKKTKPSKSWIDITKEVKVKGVKVKQIKFDVDKFAYEQKTPGYITGGESGGISFSKYAFTPGYSIPTEMFASELPGLFTKGMGWKGARVLGSAISTLNIPTQIVSGKIERVLVTKTKEESKSILTPLSSSLFGELIMEKDKQLIRQLQPQASIQQQKLQLQQRTVQQVISQPIPPINFFFPGEPIKTITKIDPEVRGKKAEAGKAYNSYYHQDATKGLKARWVQLNKKPMTQRAAESIGAEYVDNNISAKFKVVQLQKQVSGAIDTASNYLDTFRDKFRKYRVVKGKPAPSEAWIEKRKYRLDRGGETATIVTAKRTKRKTPFGF